TARQFGGQVRKDIAIHVGGDDDVEAPGIAHHVGHHRIDDDVVDYDRRKRPSDLSAFFNEKAVSDLEHVGLVHNGHVLAPRHRELEGRTGNTFAADPRDATQRNGYIFSHHHFTAAGLHVAISVEALGVFARNHEVELTATQGKARVGARRPDIREQVEALAQHH